MNFFGCCIHNNNDNKYDDHGLPERFPSAIRRATYGQRLLQVHQAWNMSKQDHSVFFLLDRNLAETFLNEFEQDDDDDDDDDEDDSSETDQDEQIQKEEVKEEKIKELREEKGIEMLNLKSKNEQRKDSVQRRTHECVVKPQKGNILLHSSLSSVNGKEWQRQRPLIQRALGGPILKKCAIDAARAATSEILRLNQNLSPPSVHPIHFVVDVRNFSIRVAVNTMIDLVFSPSCPRSEEARCILLQMFECSLAPVKQPPKKRVHALLGLVRRNLHDMLQTKNGITSAPDCVAKSLLQVSLLLSSKKTFGKTPKEDTAPTLTFEEVVSNCHSALFAGIQTISTVLTGALLHLAENGHLQKNMDRKYNNSKRIMPLVCRETMRILPPVAGLPRCPRNVSITMPSWNNSSPLCSDVESEQQAEAKEEEGQKKSANDRERQSRFPSPLKPPTEMFEFDEHNTIVLDLLTFAHGVDGPENTWKFMPMREDKRLQQLACPWGLGKRSCPAGSLSVNAICACLEFLVETNVEWQLVRPECDAVGKSGQGGWIRRTYYNPTLSYSLPVFVEFKKSS